MPTIGNITTADFSWGSNLLNATHVLSDQTVTVTTTGVEDGQVVTLHLNGYNYPGTVSSHSATVTITPATRLQALVDGTNYEFIANVSDAAGNAATTITSSSFTVDKTAPTVSSFTTTTASGSYKQNDTVAITANTNEAIQNGNTITVTLSDSCGTVVLTAPSAGTTLVGTYTVGAGHTSAGLTVSSFAIGTVADTAGNAMTSTTLPAASSIFGSKTIVIDTTAPASAAADNIAPLTIGNNTTSIQINVPIYNDSSLSGGSIQLQMETDNNGTFTDIGTSIAITSSMTNTTTTQSIDLTGTTLADGNVVTFRPVITDASGNATTGTEDSTEEFTVDYTPVINVTHNEFIVHKPSGYADENITLTATGAWTDTSVATASNYNTYTITHTDPNGIENPSIATDTAITLPYTTGLHILTYNATGLGGNVTVKRRYVLMGYIDWQDRNALCSAAKSSGDVNEDGNVNVTDILVLINKVLHS